MYQCILNFIDSAGQTVKVTIDDFNPILEPVDIADAAGEIIAIANFAPAGESLTEIKSFEVIERIITTLGGVQ